MHAFFDDLLKIMDRELAVSSVFAGQLPVPKTTTFVDDVVFEE